MATVITSIGSKSEHSGPVNAQIAVTGSSGSGTPWSGTVVYSGSDPTVNVGDILHYKDVYYNCDGYASCSDGPLEVDYLITAIDTGTNTLTIRHIRGDITESIDPFSNLDSDEAGTLAQPYIVRCFSTIALWEADLDTDVFYDSGDTAKGECYNDTTFSVAGETDITEGGTIGLDTRTLSAAVGERHDGTANSGVRLLCTSTGSSIEFLTMDSSVGSAGGTGNQIQFLEIDCNEKKILAGVRLYPYSGIQNCIVHGARWCNSNNETVGIKSYSKNTWVCNCIVYDIECDAGSESSWGTSGIRIFQNDWEVCTNNTVYGTKTNASVGETYATGLYVTSGGEYQRIYNNISMGTASDNGTATDFITQTSTTYTDANYSSDTSAPGDTNYRSESAADTFVSTDTDSEDFHLKDGSNALAAGKDAGANETVGGRQMPYSPYTWSVDIDGRDRDGEGDDWDIGADQCHTCSEAAGGTTNAAFLLLMD